ncbi:MAG: DUF1499 domain-containing protein [Pseudomonadota bacterium]|nr:DUF1499 domain-containing protein [Pseudomonadota bacterium]
MSDTARKGEWGRRLSWLALALSAGGLAAALIAAAGRGADAWTFGTGFAILRYAFYAAVAGGLLAIVAFFVARSGGERTGRLNLIALVIAAAFGVYLMNQVATAKSVPAIHDATTDLSDVPMFETLEVRADNLENVPDDGRAELAALDPTSRWKAIHREAYGDLRSLRLPLSVAEATRRAEALARDRGWEVARVDPRAGIVEATATTLFFRFKDDVAVRVRPDPKRPGGSVVDMRSISRVGGSDVGVNAARIKAFLADLQAG